MRRLLIFLCFLCSLISQVKAQTYTFTSGLPLNDINGVGAPVTLTPTTPSAALPIGFSFKFYNNTYTDFYINPQGTLTFTGGSTVVCKALVSTPTPHGNLLGTSPEIDNFIAFAWQAATYDFSNATVNYFTTGTAPDRILVVNYKNVLTSRLTYVIGPVAGGYKDPGNGQIDVQIQLYEGSHGKIEIHGINNKTIPYPIFSPDADGPGQCGLKAADGVTVKIASRYVAYIDNETYDFSNQAIRFTYSGPPAALTLTPSASPATLLTSGTTTLAATATGGTAPYTYTFSGPGTITPSGNTAIVSGLSAGIQTFTVIASDATTPTSQTVSGTVSVTVTQANAPPAVSNAIPSQSVTVGQAFSYVIPASTFSDPNNDALTLSVSGLPAGLSFTVPATISGVPSVSGVSTVTVVATDPGGLSVSTSFSLLVSEIATLGGCASLLVTGSDIGGSGANGTYVRVGTTNSYTLAGSNSLCQGMSVSGKFTIYFDAVDNRWEWSVPGCGQFLKNDNIPANNVPPQTGWTTNSGFMLGITPGTVSCNGAPMPVRLTSFVVRLTANKQVALRWQTSFEHNADYFSVERSTDLITFQPIARVQASGNASSLKDYSLTDEIPLRGLSYYRLKQADLDGTSHTYPAVSIRTEGTDVLYPNPSNGTFINLDVAATSTIELLTLTGKSLSFDRKKVSESSIQLSPKTALTPGIYLIRVDGLTRRWVVE